MSNGTTDAETGEALDPLFVFGFALDGQGGGRPLGEHEAVGGPCWLHIDYAVPGANDWLTERGLNPLVVESLTRFETRPRALKVDGGLLLNLRAINLNKGEEREDMVSLRFWIEPDRLISARQRRTLAVQDVRAEIEAASGPSSVQALVLALIERLADRVATYVDEIEERIVVFEEEVETKEPSELRNAVADLRRQIAMVRRFLAPQRDALETFYRIAEGVFSQAEIFAVREQSDRITRYVEDLDLVRERALVVQEELLNRINQEQNNRMYVLSIVAAVFLPISFISGFFGMNTAGLPGVEEDAATFLVIALMIMVTLGTLAYFRLRRWL